MDLMRGLTRIGADGCAVDGTGASREVNPLTQMMNQLVMGGPPQPGVMGKQGQQQGQQHGMHQHGGFLGNQQYPQQGQQQQHIFHGGIEDGMNQGMGLIHRAPGGISAPGMPPALMMQQQRMMQQQEDGNMFLREFEAERARQQMGNILGAHIHQPGMAAGATAVPSSALINPRFAGNNVSDQWAAQFDRMNFQRAKHMNAGPMHGAYADAFGINGFPRAQGWTNEFLRAPSPLTADRNGAWRQANLNGISWADEASALKQVGV
jgi:hypothetical protein